MQTLGIQTCKPSGHYPLLNTINNKERCNCLCNGTHVPAFKNTAKKPIHQTSGSGCRPYNYLWSDRKKMCAWPCLCQPCPLCHTQSPRGSCVSLRMRVKSNAVCAPEHLFFLNPQHELTPQRRSNLIGGAGVVSRRVTDGRRLPFAQHTPGYVKKNQKDRSLLCRESPCWQFQWWRPHRRTGLSCCQSSH